MHDYIETLMRARAATRAQEWGAAAELWEALTRRNPTIGSHFSALGVSLYRTGNYNKAARAFARVIELGAMPDYHLMPDIFALSPDALADFERASWPWGAEYFIACCRVQCGEKNRALEALKRALKAGFRYRFGLREDARLTLLHGDKRFRKLIGVDPAPPLRDEGWREDLRLLAEEIERIHFDPFRHVSRAKLRIALHAIAAEVPRLTDVQIVAQIMQTLTLLRAGHTQLAWWDEKARLGGAVPLTFFLFEEGLFITEAAPIHQDALGAQILEVAGRPVGEVLTALESCVSRDNPMWFKAMTPLFLRRPALLHALNLVPSDDALPLLLADVAGKRRTLRVALGARDENDTALWLTLPQRTQESGGPEVPLYLRRGKPYAFAFTPDGTALHFSYKAVAPDEEESFEIFCGRMFAAAKERDAKRLIVDLRGNFGGNSFLLAPLFEGIAANANFRRRGGLFVITGRGTFSAAMNCAAHLERNANAIFVGEPTGTSPNFVGETVIVRLPHSGLPVAISDLYWQGSWPMDKRPWIPPLLYAPPTFADYRINRDPALEAIRAFPANL